MCRATAFISSLTPSLIHTHHSLRTTQPRVRYRHFVSHCIQATALSDRHLIDRVLTHWFGTPSPPRYHAFSERGQLWYSSTPDQDAEIRQQFEPDILKALNGTYDHLITSEQFPATGPLALAILLDQYPRNIYRRTPKAFAGDARALDVAQYVIDNKWDVVKEQLGPVVRCSFILPLMHQETIPELDKCLKIAEQMRQECIQAGEEADSCLQALESTMHFCEKHLGIVQQFGRYPHRNDVLGRQSTPEEIEFLKDGDRFGQ